MRIIAFAGPKGCGKDTAARYLIARNSLLKDTMFRQINFAESLKLIVELGFGYTPAELNDPALKEVMIDRWPNKTPRAMLQNVANLFRTLYAQDIWVKAWERKAKMLSTSGNCLIVTDLRHIEEVEKLRELGAKVVYIHNDKVEEERRLGIERGDPLWCDSSEAFAEHLRLEADVIVHNDGVSLDNLYTNTHKAILELYGDWKDWQELARVDPVMSQAPVIL